MDKDIALTSIENFGDSLEFLPNFWKNDRKCVELATSNSENALIHATDHLKKNHKLVKHSVSKFG